MQRFHYITPMITLNESSLSGLVHTSVTNNLIVYWIEGAVVVKKATWIYQHPMMWMSYLNKKVRIWSVPDPFGADTYTASDKCPVPNIGLAMRD